jgi:hypothetical protein
MSTSINLRPCKIYRNCDFWFENKPSGNPAVKLRPKLTHLVDSRCCSWASRSGTACPSSRPPTTSTSQNLPTSAWYATHICRMSLTQTRIFLVVCAYVLLWGKILPTYDFIFGGFIFYVKGWRYVHDVCTNEVALNIEHWSIWVFCYFLRQTASFWKKYSPTFLNSK